MSNCRLAATVLVLAFLVSPATGQIILPDPVMSIVWTDYPGQETLSVMALPDGGGDSFALAFTNNGSRVSGVIHIQLIDPMGYPIEGYAYEDIWFEADDGGLSFCGGGNLADANTDSDGQTEFRRPFYAGGVSMGLLGLYVSGMRVVSSAGVAIQVNSPDLDGDLDVDLSDVVLFVGDFFGTYQYRSDLHRDGVVNLSDLTRMVGSVGAGCP